MLLNQIGRVSKNSSRPCYTAMWFNRFMNGCQNRPPVIKHNLWGVINANVFDTLHIDVFTLGKAMAWRRQSTSHYPSQCWRWSISSYVVTRPQWVMMTSSNGNIFRVTGPLWGNSPVPVNSPHKGQWHGALILSLICVWIKCWVKKHEAGDFRRHRGHYDVSVMYGGFSTQ